MGRLLLARSRQGRRPTWRYGEICSRYGEIASSSVAAGSATCVRNTPTSGREGGIVQSIQSTVRIRGARIQRLQRAAVEHTLSTPPLECWFEYKNTYSASRTRDMGRYGEIWGDIRLLGPATALSAAEMPPCPATPAEHDGSGDAPPLPPTPAARPYRLPRHFLDTSQTLHRHLPRGRAGCLRAGPASRAPLDRPCRHPTFCRAATRRWPAAGERCLRGGRRG